MKDEEIKIKILIDNKAGSILPLSKKLSLHHEHGLSMLVDYGGCRILFDTGKSSFFADNADILGVNLENINYGVISHGHYDHGGGLERFFEINSATPVFIHKEAVLPSFFNTGGRVPKYIGIPGEAYAEHQQRFRLISSETKLYGTVYLKPCSSITGRGPIFRDPRLSVFRDGEWEPDSFDHELFMVIERAADVVIISGCSHNSITAIVNDTLRSFSSKPVKAVIGGFHMPDIAEYSDVHRDAVIRTAEELSASCPEAVFITGHCTGDKAKAVLTEILGNRISFFKTGEDYSI